MENVGVRPSRYGNLGTAQLVEKALERKEGLLASGGALVVRTGQFTGRSPKDKYIVREPDTETTVDWGSVNQPMPEQIFDRFIRGMMKFWEGEEVFVQDCFAGRGHRNTRCRFAWSTQRAWHALFARQFFVRPIP